MQNATRLVLEPQPNATSTPTPPKRDRGEEPSCAELVNRLILSIRRRPATV